MSNKIRDICNNCGKTRILFYTKKLDYTTLDNYETFHWLCKKCISCLNKKGTCHPLLFGRLPLEKEKSN